MLDIIVYVSSLLLTYWVCVDCSSADSGNAADSGSVFCQLQDHSQHRHSHYRCIHNTGMLIHNTGMLIHNTRVMIHNTRVMIHNTGVLIHNAGVLIHNAGVLIHNAGVLIHNAGVLIHNTGVLSLCLPCHLLHIIPPESLGLSGPIHVEAHLVAPDFWQSSRLKYVDAKHINC